MLDKRQQLTMLASIKEFWTYNKNYIYVLPFVAILVQVLFLIKPEAYLNKLLFSPSALESPYVISQHMLYGYGNMRVFLLAIVPLMIILCSHNYLIKIKIQSRFLTTPITDSQRIGTLWLFTILISVIGTLNFYLIDLATATLFKHYLWDETQRINESIGVLYPNYGANSYFEHVPLIQAAKLPLAFCIALPLYHLMYFMFAKRSILLSSILYVLIIVSLTLIYTRFFSNNFFAVAVPAKSYIVNLLYVLVIGAYIVSLRFALKEREV